MATIIKGTVIFGKESDRWKVLCLAMEQMIKANRNRDVASSGLYDTPETLRFIPGDDPKDWRVGPFPLPDRWFVYWSVM